jgi:hypothetical protein
MCISRSVSVVGYISCTYNVSCVLCIRYIYRGSLQGYCLPKVYSQQLSQRYTLSSEVYVMERLQRHSLAKFLVVLTRYLRYIPWSVLQRYALYKMDIYQGLVHGYSLSVFFCGSLQDTPYLSRIGCRCSLSYVCRQKG